MIYLPNGTKFAKNDREFIETLFSKGMTASGYYKQTKNKIIFSDMRKQVIVALVLNKNGSFLVNCTRLNNKLFYQYGLSSFNEKLFGVPAGYMDSEQYIQALAESHLREVIS